MTDEGTEATEAGSEAASGATVSAHAAQAPAPAPASAPPGPGDDRDLPLDAHLHTNLSHDSDVPIDAYCALAVARGIPEIAITDHVDFDPRAPDHAFASFATRERAESGRLPSAW